MITYLVSGAIDILPAHELLAQAGRAVRHGVEVGGSASDELIPGSRYVVIAHGDEEGSVYWARGAGAGERWLWVGMEPAPIGARVYLYCCSAGPRLAEYLRDCECFGHSSAVPMPVDEWADVVIVFLDKVDRLMAEINFDEAIWRDELAMFIGEKMSDEIEAPSSLLSSLAWLLLGKSIGMSL